VDIYKLRNSKNATHEENRLKSLFELCFDWLMKTHFKLCGWGSYFCDHAFWGHVTYFFAEAKGSWLVNRNDKNINKNMGLVVTELIFFVTCAYCVGAYI
jgi:hypothetical protein